MKKSIISLAVAAGLVASMPAQAGDIKVKWFGFAQITAAQGDGLDPGTKDATGPVFGADRVRFGFKIKDGKVFGGLQADLNRKHESTAAKDGTLPEIIKDAFGGYKFNDAASIKVGQFKTPVGMDFNTSGKKLDITKRSMEKGLVLERAAGGMLSGRKIANGFGYDLFYGNVSGRSAAYGGSKDNTDASYAFRVMYDMGKMFHIEGSYGVTTDSTTGSEDYSVFDVAAKFKSGPHTVKGEYIAGSNVKNTKDSDENVWYLHYGFMVTKKIELLARHYQASSDKAGLDSTSMSNTYLGANFFLGSNKTNGRVQLNYVIASGDNDVNGTTVYNGVAAKGYYDDVLLAQYQVSF